MKTVHARRLCQGAVLALCLAAVGGFLARDMDFLDLLPRFSPLLAITTRIATRAWVVSFAPAALFVALGLVWPRFFCGWVCPLGTLIDCVGRVWASARPCVPTGPKPRLQLGIMLALVLVAIAGVNPSAWLDPMSLLTRSAGAPGVPTWAEAYHWPVSMRQSGFWDQEALIHQINALSALVLVGVLGLTIRGPRTWCRTACPLGGLYGLLARVALVGRFVGDQCTQCGHCASRCAMAALAPDGTLVEPSLCVGCRLCAAVGPEGAVSFSIAVEA